MKKRPAPFPDGVSSRRDTNPVGSGARPRPSWLLSPSYQKRHDLCGAGSRGVVAPKRPSVVGGGAGVSSCRRCRRRGAEAPRALRATKRSSFSAEAGPATAPPRRRLVLLPSLCGTCPGVWPASGLSSTRLTHPGLTHARDIAPEAA